MEKREMRDKEIRGEHPVAERQEAPEDVVTVEATPEERISELEEELAEVRDRHVRLYAEFENYKKRVQKDREELIKYSLESFIMELLTVMDSLEMAVEHAGRDATAESLLKGVTLTIKEFKRVLSKYGVREIEALRMPFDPAYHHAMNHIEAEDVEDNTVIEEYRRGYILNDKVIRPSLVAVSKATEAPAGAEEKTEDNNGVKEE